MFQVGKLSPEKSILIPGRWADFHFVLGADYFTEEFL